ncbi:MAG: hypothetical protein U1E83_01440 [Methylotetracoccus sp.]
MPWLVLLLAAVLFASAAAEDSPAEGQDLESDQVRALSERYHRERRALIARNLTLTPEEARHFWPLYDRYERELQHLTLRRRALIGVFGENYDAMTDAMARKIMNERLDIEEERTRIRRLYIPRFEKVLPIRKLARYLQIEAKIRAAVEAGIAEELPLIE